MKKKNLGFTLAEVLIVIGIIGVVAALTLPNLNHATGDKETVTRLKKAYSILNEANDRAVAIYGPVSTWKSNEQCENNFQLCYMKRIGEFLKISKSCNELVDSDSDDYSSCDLLDEDGDFDGNVIYQLPDGITFASGNGNPECNDTFGVKNGMVYYNDLCFDGFHVDINGPSGKNMRGQEVFRFYLSDSLGVVPYVMNYYFEDSVTECMSSKNDDACTWWVMEYGNLDYLKTDSTGKCNDSNIILDGTTNTSCH